MVGSPKGWYANGCGCESHILYCDLQPLMMIFFSKKEVFSALLFKCEVKSAFKSSQKLCVFDGGTIHLSMKTLNAQVFLGSKQEKNIWKVIRPGEAIMSSQDRWPLHCYFPGCIKTMTIYQTREGDKMFFIIATFDETKQRRTKRLENQFSELTNVTKILINVGGYTCF